MLIAGSSAMDTATPAEACNVARALGARGPGARHQLRLHELLRQPVHAVADGSGASCLSSFWSSCPKR
jgi:hypothetical protein